MAGTPNFPVRFSLAGILGGLMLAENLGDVKDEIDHLHDLIGLNRPTGNFVDGWADTDLLQIGIVPDHMRGESAPDV